MRIVLQRVRFAAVTRQIQKASSSDEAFLFLRMKKLRGYCCDELLEGCAGGVGVVVFELLPNPDPDCPNDDCCPPNED